MSLTYRLRAATIVASLLLAVGCSVSLNGPSDPDLDAVREDPAGHARQQMSETQEQLRAAGTDREKINRACQEFQHESSDWTPSLNLDDYELSEYQARQLDRAWKACIFDPQGTSVLIGDVLADRKSEPIQGFRGEFERVVSLLPEQWDGRIESIADGCAALRAALDESEPRPRKANETLDTETRDELGRCNSDPEGTRERLRGLLSNGTV